MTNPKSKIDNPKSLGLLLITGNQTHQENYGRALAADPRCRLIGVSDEPGLPPRREKLNRTMAQELSVPYFDDLEAALARDDVQIVCLCAEPERRERLTVKCAQAGKHLYLDKEIASTVEGCRNVVEAVKQAGVVAQTFSLVRSPVARQAREILDGGRLGTLTAVHCEQFFAKGITGTADLSRPRQERADVPRLTFFDSKRELLCVGWYPLVLFGWLTGQRVQRVQATTGNYFFAEHQRNGVEDFASLLLEYDKGLVATITVGRTGWMSHPTHGVYQVQLTGTKGNVFLDAHAPRLEVWSDAQPWRQPAAAHPEDPMGFWTSSQQAGGVTPKTAWQPVQPALQSDAAWFLDCVTERRESDVNAALGAHIVEVIFAAYRAAASGKPIEL